MERLKMRKVCLAMLATTMVLLSSLAQAQEVIVLSDFQQATATPPAPWTLLQLDKKVAPTKYAVSEWDGVLSIEARAHESMALLARPVVADLNRTPILCWRWRVDAPLDKADMATKQGDDYAARVYVAFKLPDSAMDFSTRTKLRIGRALYGDAVPDAALNYVWDNRYPIGTQRPNAYTDRTQMIVVETGAAKAGKWVWERRDLAADFQAAFASDQGVINSLAVASDTDNTHEDAHAGFADIHLVGRDQPCVTPHSND